MVNEIRKDDAVTAERTLALSYAPVAVRAGLAALLALDDRLGSIVRRASEPMIGLMRLAWWAEALAALDTAPPPPEPLLRALATAGVGGADLAGMVDGWALFLESEPLDPEVFGRERGGRLFAAMAGLLGEHDDRVAAAGAGWAMADLAGHLTDAHLSEKAARLAGERLGGLFDAPWPRRLRPLGALSLLARSDLAGGWPGSPARVGRLLLHRLTGR